RCRILIGMRPIGCRFRNAFFVATQDYRRSTMTQFTRRDVFATAAGAAVATVAGFNPLTTTPAVAATAGKGTGVYRYKFGDYEIIQLMDGARTFAMPDKFVVNVSKDE